MSAPKPGDRVRVTEQYTATMDAPYVPGKPGMVWVHADDGRTVIVPVAAVEVIRTPLAVGDVVRDAEDLDALPDYSVVKHADADGYAAQKLRGRWSVAAVGPEHPVAASTVLLWREVVVLHIGASG